MSKVRIPRLIVGTPRTRATHPAPLCTHSHACRAIDFASPFAGALGRTTPLMGCTSPRHISATPVYACALAALSFLLAAAEFPITSKLPSAIAQPARASARPAICGSRNEIRGDEERRRGDDGTRLHRDVQPEPHRLTADIPALPLAEPRNHRAKGE